MGPSRPPPANGGAAIMSAIDANILKQLKGTFDELKCIKPLILL
jgi:hypothetical protein